MMKRIKEKILAIFGSISYIFGFVGVMGWCCTPLIVSFFALFGITSTAFLLTYNWLFLLMGIFSLILALIFYLKRIEIKKMP